MDNALNLLKDNREIIEIALIFLFAFSSKVREAIATVAKMLENTTQTDPDAAMNKAVSLLRNRVTILRYVPTFVLKAAIQWLYNSISRDAKKEVAEIKQWGSKLA